MSRIADALPSNRYGLAAAVLIVVIGVSLYRTGAFLSLELLKYSAYAEQWQVSYATGFVLGMAFTVSLFVYTNRSDLL